jgi:hypothetical protein
LSKLSFKLLGGALTFVFLGIFIWPIVDEPIDTGARIQGKVSECNGSAKSARRCLIQSQTIPSLIMTNASTAKSGDNVTLAVFERQISHAKSYVIVSIH